MGFLAAFAHGCTTVLPCQQFDANNVVQAIEAEQCTVPHGVQIMFGAELQAVAKTGNKFSCVRVALAAVCATDDSGTIATRNEYY